MGKRYTVLFGGPYRGFPENGHHAVGHSIGPDELSVAEPWKNDGSVWRFAGCMEALRA